MTTQEKKKVDLRLQFIHKPIRKCWHRRSYPFLIQNEPFEYGLRIKNIGETPFSGATIKRFTIQSTGSGVFQNATKTVKIKALNPGEEYELYFDKYTLWHEGSVSTDCVLVPDRDDEEIQTYQHHRDHDVDEPNKINEWWHDYYCQSQQQLLQTRTNNLILLLTSITVLEAIFGLNEILKFFSALLAWSFNELHVLFAWLAK